MRSKFENQQPQKLLCTIRQAASMLALSVSTIRRYVDSGILPSVHVGKRRLIKVRDVVTLAENGYSLARLQRVREALKQTSTGETANDRT